MKTVRKGLRDGELEKDTYERLHCSECEKALKTQRESGEVGSVRVCQECNSEWRELQ